MELYMNEELKRQDEYVYNEIFVWNTYNLLEEDIKGRELLDIGSQYGMFTLKALDLGVKTVFCFEANIDNYKQSLKNLSSYKNVYVQNLAVVGDDKDNQIFYIDNAGGHSRIRENGILPVKSISFSKCTELLQKGSVLKMDIEGSEHSLLYHTDPSILKKFELIFIEIHNFEGNTIKNLIDYIKNAGFKLIGEWTFYMDYPDGRRLCEDIWTFKFKRLAG